MDFRQWFAMPRIALIERILPRIKVQRNGCWIWTGAKSKGYGVLRRGRKNILVHRLLWVLGNNRKIPKKHEPHHRCETPSCVRPFHLKMMTHHDHLLISNGAAGLNARKRRCVRGHRFTPDNTILYKRHRTWGVGYERICRACRRKTMKKWRRRCA